MRKKKKKLIVIDCETDPFSFDKPVAPFIWGVYDGKDYREYKSATDMINYLADQHAYVYAHNGGKFDYMFLTQHIEYGQQLSFINNRLSSFRIGDAEFRDSLNILPVPLAKLAKDDFDYTKLHIDVRHKHTAEISAYLKSDCVNLYRFVKAFTDEYGHKITLASAAFSHFYSMRKGEKKPKSTKAYYDEFYPFYYGGRTQAFRQGIFEVPFYYLDINSAYPAKMRDVIHPYGHKYGEGKRVIDSNLELSFIELTCDSFGAFPKRNMKRVGQGEERKRNPEYVKEWGEGLFFPEGRYRFTVTGHEFKAALETNTIKNIDIHNVYTFTDYINFTDYVEHFYKIKSESEKGSPEYQIAKLFLNSLYGKYAMNSSEFTEDYFDSYGLPYVERVGKDENVYRLPQGPAMGHGQIYSRVIPPEMQRYYNIATAASITGAVRAYLWESICKCDGVFYCDTDSIICEGHTGLNVTEKLGDWDIEGQGDKIVVAGKKMYAARVCDSKGNYDWKIASKGVRLDQSEIERVARGETVEYFNPAPNIKISGHQEFTKRKIKMRPLPLTYAA